MHMSINCHLLTSRWQLLTKLAQRENQSTLRKNGNFDICEYRLISSFLERICLLNIFGCSWNRSIEFNLRFLPFFLFYLICFSHKIRESYVKWNISSGIYNSNENVSYTISFSGGNERTCLLEASGQNRFCC